MIAILATAVLIWIAIDSFGSKKIRQTIINATTKNFQQCLEEENHESLLHQIQGLSTPLRNYLERSQALAALPLQTTRLKFKGVSKRQDRKRWIPIEAKLFLTGLPLTLAYYEDRTLGLFVSGKRVQLLQKDHVTAQYKVGSLFQVSDQPQGEAFVEVLVQVLGHLPWHADLLLLPNWLWDEANEKQVKGTFYWGNQEIELNYQFDKDGHIKSFLTRIPNQETLQSAVIEIEYHYFDYKELDGYHAPSHYQVLRSAGKKPGTIAKFDITEVVQNSPFAWW